MSKNYDHHWNKPNTKPAPKRPRKKLKNVKTPPGQKAYQDYLKAKQVTVAATENFRRVGEIAIPVLREFGFTGASRVPDGFCMELVLAGRGGDAKWVRHYYDGRDRVRAAEYREQVMRSRVPASMLAPPPPKPEPVPKTVAIRPIGQTAGSGVLPQNPPAWHATTPPWLDGPA